MLTADEFSEPGAGGAGAAIARASRSLSPSFEAPAVVLLYVWVTRYAKRSLGSEIVSSNLIATNSAFDEDLRICRTKSLGARP